MRAPEVRRPGAPSFVRPAAPPNGRCLAACARAILLPESNGRHTWPPACSRRCRTDWRARRSVVAVHARRRIPASGVLWRPGVVVATSHTIRRDDDITVALDGGRTVRATLAGRDQGTDLAVLRLEGSPDAPVATFGDPGAIRVGQLALAL